MVIRLVLNNNTLSITKTVASTVALTAIWAQSAPTTLNINDNTVTNFTYAGTSTSTTDVGAIRSGLAAGTLNINNNTISGVSLTGASGPFFCISNSGAATTAVNITGNNITGIAYSIANSKALNVITNTGAANTATVTVSNNNIQGISYAALGTGANTYITATGTPLNNIVTGNTFTNLNVNTTGTITFISQSYTNSIATGTKTASNNSIVTGFTRAATAASGSIILITDNGSSVTGTVRTVANNNFSNITVSGTATITGINLTDGGTAPTKNITGNTLSNWTAGTGAINTVNITYWNGVSTLSNNTISNINGQGIITGITIGSTVNTATSITVSGNLINNLKSTGTGGAVTGISCTNTSTIINITGNTIDTLSSTGASAVTAISIGGATNTSVYKNKIYGLTGNNASSTVNGILVSAGTLVNVHTNIIGDLNVSIANAANPLNGINVTGGTAVNIYYNTVSLNASSSGALFGSSSVSVSSTPTVTLRNNILVNNSVFSGAGITAAYRRSTATLTSYASASNNNLFYAGTSSANNLIYYDGTNSDQTLIDYKNRVTPRDNLSFSENSSFVSTTGADTTYLHLSPSVATQSESGGASISGITTDFDGDTRNAGNPDVGADEFNGISIDLTAPGISINALGSATICTSNRVVTATITDATGVNVTPGLKPRLWFKKATENDVLPATNTSASNGWKWVETSSSTSPFTFTFDYSLLTSSVLAGDSISYFITAQDINTTPNAGASIVTFSSSISSVALSSGAFPTSGNVKGFLILNQPSPLTIKANKTDVCAKGTVTLDVDGIDITGGELQWQKSPAGANTFTNIAGATTVPYTTDTITANTDFRLVVSCGGTPIAGSPSFSVTLTVNNPQVTSTTPGTRCGVGTVDLTATAPGYDVKWYAAANGGSPLFVGNTFTTPSLSATTTYYVAAVTAGGGAGTNAVGAGATTSATYSNPFYSAWSNTHNQHIVLASELTAAGILPGNITALGLDVTVAGTLPMIDLSVKIGTTTASNMSAYVSTGSFSTVYTSASLLPTTGINTLTFSSPFYWDGSSNIVIEFCHGNPGSTATMSRTVKTDATSYVSTIHTQKSAANSSSLQCADNTTNLLTYSVRPQFYFTFVSGCEGIRTAVLATVNTAPAIAASSPMAVICNGSSATLNATSLNSGYVYTWTPIGLTGASVSVTPGSTTKYYVNALDNTTTCTALDSVTVTVQPVPTISHSVAALCQSGVATFSLTPSTGYAANSIQWQSSSNNVTFTDIPSATNTSYTTPTLTDTTYYKALIKDGSGATCTQLLDSVVVNNPAITSVGSATRCGVGTVNLTAVAPGYDILWYANSSGGTSIGTGNTFTTPSISNTTTYYVAASSPGGSGTVGPLNPTAVGTISASAFAIGTYYQSFDVLSPTTLVSVDIFPTATVGTNASISIANSSGTILATVPYTVADASGTVAQTISLNVPLTVGTGYRIGQGGTAINLNRNTTGAVYPYTSSVINVTGNNFNTAYWYYTYNWQFSSNCEGTRTPVTATVTPPPSITASSPLSVLCSGASATLNVTSSNTNYTYTWTPGSSLTGSSVSVTPGSTTKYYVNALDNTTTCTALDSVTVTVQPVPTISHSVAALCQSGVATFSLTPSTGYAVNSIQWQSSSNNVTFTDIPSATNTSYTTPTLTDTTYYKALIKDGSGATCTQLLDSALVNNPAITSVGSGTRCGAGTVNLTAVAPGYDIKWYANSSGGTSIGTGNTFTTPSISNSTTYYVSASTAGGTESAGRATYTGTANTIGNAWGLVFNVVTAPITLQSVDVYSVGSATGTISVQLTDNTGAVLATAGPFAYPVGSTTSPVAVTLPVNFTIPVGTGYRLLSSSASGGALIRETTGIAYPYTSSSSNVSITSGYISGTTATTYYWFYNWQVSAGCEGSRTPVTATVDNDPGCTAVPVNLLTFTGERKGGINQLTWKTATETNNAGFELQRSADGLNFSKLSFIASKGTNGNSTQTLTYNFDDVLPLIGNGYYRLKQIDKDGRANYSVIVLIKGVKSTKLELVSVYPNPVVSMMTVSIVSPMSDKVTLIVSDITGKTIITKPVGVITGENNFTINVSMLAKGTYTVKAICANGCETAVRKFVKD